MACQQGYTPRSGEVRGATSYSLAGTAASSFSYTSEGCGLVDTLQTHYCVSCCAGCAGSFGKTFPCSDADPSYNLYNSSAMPFVVNYDLFTTFDPGGVARTGEIRFTATVVARWLRAGHDCAGRRRRRQRHLG